ncbi:unnamed protein product [Schistosoma bovis]|uniref:C8 domain-containing protein n=1 Tax=Schistosoma mattheei TaxID=31246 RepID=A0AA85BNX4_9TREM|nr:unnamed protein product [Schistosoma mattheei]CAH8532721.1 unnamed protein product [Schistosoma intercalatum]CAH8532762.1 unnamed protein product [Schistosoma intercalatum]CAH8543480.1 unnamed protein product [Schistosoma bovis]CAH8547097.1 unnamed protein product [Schistosoma bovis]
MLKYYTCTFLCYICLIIVIEARTRTKDYDKNLGVKAVTRLCGMEGEECMDDFNCCEEYECSPDLQCQLRNARNKIVGSYRNLCVADYDCPPGWCCEGKLYARRCTQDCSRKTEPDVVPAGSYYGRQFWNLWAHKRHMDRNHY